MTLTQSLRALIIGDGTLAAKVGTAVYPNYAPQSPPNNFVVIKVISGSSWETMAGATDQTRVRLEVTFWCALELDSEVLVNRLRTIVKGINGALGGGVTFTTCQTLGPRTVVHPESRFHGAQLDILGIADMSTAS